GGRYAVVHEKNYLQTSLRHAQDARVVARLLQLDALLRAEEGDVDGALESCRAILNVGRSLGDEPIVMSQLVRRAIGSYALHVVERVLAQGEPSDQALATIQGALADESGQIQALSLSAYRGDRAQLYELMGRLATGEVAIDALSGD